MKNRTMIGILCIVLSITVMFGVSPIVNKMASGKVTAYQVNKVVEQGNVITTDDVVKVEIGSHGIAEGLINDPNAVVGKYAKTDLYPKVNIYPEMISDKADSAEDIFKTLDGKKLAMSITIPSFANGLSGKLKNGDIVSVVVTEDLGSSIPAELTYVKVVTSTTSKGTDSDNLTQNEDGTTDLPATVTLIVNPQQSKLLGNFEQKAKMHLALVYRGNEETSSKFLEAQEKVFTEKTTDKISGGSVNE